MSSKSANGDHPDGKEAQSSAVEQREEQQVPVEDSSGEADEVDEQTTSNLGSHPQDRIIEDQDNSDTHVVPSTIPIDIGANVVERVLRAPWASRQGEASSNNFVASRHHNPEGVKQIVVDIEHMKNSVYFLYPDREDRLSRFWSLLLLAAVIATSGIVANSSATVIGAMIVAPLMIPIQGCMLSMVLNDRRNFIFSFLLTATGVGACIFVGYLYGLGTLDETISKENNEQVASRVRPIAPDLIGAIATGAVGSLALVRKDIGGAVPGVAISISLVPPLCVVGLTLSSGKYNDAGGAMLLFICNFMSIQVMGIFIMLWYRVHRMARQRRSRWSLVVLMVLMLCGVAIPLGFASRKLNNESRTEQCLRKSINKISEPEGWEVEVVTARQDVINSFSASVLLSGEPPIPDLDELDPEYIDENCDNVDSVSISFFPYKEIEE